MLESRGAAESEMVDESVTVMMFASRDTGEDCAMFFAVNSGTTTFKTSKPPATPSRVPFPLVIMSAGLETSARGGDVLPRAEKPDGVAAIDTSGDS